MANPSSNGKAIDNALERERPVKALLRLTETAGFLQSTDGRFYAHVSFGGRPETYTLKKASPHVSVSDIESCFDEPIDGEKSVTDVTLMAAMA